MAKLNLFKNGREERFVKNLPEWLNTQSWESIELKIEKSELSDDALVKVIRVLEQAKKHSNKRLSVIDKIISSDVKKNELFRYWQSLDRTRRFSEEEVKIFYEKYQKEFIECFYTIRDSNKGIVLSSLYGLDGFKVTDFIEMIKNSGYKPGVIDSAALASNCKYRGDELRTIIDAKEFGMDCDFVFYRLYEIAKEDNISEVIQMLSNQELRKFINSENNWSNRNLDLNIRKNVILAAYKEKGVAILSDSGSVIYDDILKTLLSQGRSKLDSADWEELISCAMGALKDNMENMVNFFDNYLDSSMWVDMIKKHLPEKEDQMRFVSCLIKGRPSDIKIKGFLNILNSLGIENIELDQMEEGFKKGVYEHLASHADPKEALKYVKKLGISEYNGEVLKDKFIYAYLDPIEKMDAFFLGARVFQSNTTTPNAFLASCLYSNEGFSYALDNYFIYDGDNIALGVKGGTLFEFPNPPTDDIWSAKLIADYCNKLDDDKKLFEICRYFFDKCGRNGISTEMCRLFTDETRLKLINYIKANKSRNTINSKFGIDARIMDKDERYHTWREKFPMSLNYVARYDAKEEDLYDAADVAFMFQLSGAEKNSPRRGLIVSKFWDAQKAKNNGDVDKSKAEAIMYYIGEPNVIVIIFNSMEDKAIRLEVLGKLISAGEDILAYKEANFTPEELEYAIVEYCKKHFAEDEIFENKVTQIVKTFGLSDEIIIKLVDKFDNVDIKYYFATNIKNGPAREKVLDRMRTNKNVSREEYDNIISSAKAQGITLSEDQIAALQRRITGEPITIVIEPPVKEKSEEQKRLEEEQERLKKNAILRERSEARRESLDEFIASSEHRAKSQALALEESKRISDVREGNNKKEEIANPELALEKNRMESNELEYIISMEKAESEKRHALEEKIKGYQTLKALGIELTEDQKKEMEEIDAILSSDKDQEIETRSTELEANDYDDKTARTLDVTRLEGKKARLEEKRPTANRGMTPEMSEAYRAYYAFEETGTINLDGISPEAREILREYLGIDDSIEPEDHTKTM